MKLMELQTIAVLTILIIFIIWSSAQIIDDLLLGNRGVTIPDQFWGLLGIVLGSLLYALKYGRKNGNGNGDIKKTSKEEKEEVIEG